MRRTTVLLPDDLDDRVRLEADRRGVPIGEIVREALAERYPAVDGEPLSFVGIGGSGRSDGSERLEAELRGVVSRRRRR